MSEVSFINSFVASPPSNVLPDSELYGPDPYDINFSFVLNLESLKTDELLLAPFVPRIHAAAYWEQAGPHPEFFKYYPFLNSTLPDFLTYIERSIRQHPDFIMFALIDRTCIDPERPALGGRLAGMMGFFNASPVDLSAEIAHVLVFPEWQGTGIGARAAALLTRLCLALPSANPPGLGLRRVQWVAHVDNAPSRGLATRLGMKHEALLRWHRVIPEGRPGRESREGDPRPSRVSRDSVILAMCCDDWEEGQRDHVQGLIDKPLKLKN